MSDIKIKIGDAAGKEEEPQSPQASMSIVARKTLNGDIAVMDHLDLDIIIMPGKNKILTFAKEEQNDAVYDAQHRFFEYLKKKGVVAPDSIQGGNIYGSLEAAYPEQGSDGENSHQIILFTIGKFIEEEKPYFMWDAAHRKSEVERLLEPDVIDSTEYGEVPQKVYKGSIPRKTAYPYGGGFHHGN